jgi:hypothetical protein
MVDHGPVVGNATRALIISNRRITGLTAGVIAELVVEIGRLWHERHQARPASRPRKRALGSGAKHRLVFADRLLATLVHLRHGVTHDVLACWYGADRSTITRAVNEVRPLLAERGCPVSPDVRLRSLAEAVDHLGASGKTARGPGRSVTPLEPTAGFHPDPFTRSPPLGSQAPAIRIPHARCVQGGRRLRGPCHPPGRRRLLSRRPGTS